ncbi:hypothetical protein GORBP_071_00250 [Gordonia rubripertincta NBRC 101908]|uniref:DNA ligase (ATP) n=1 Tax=Gordonia rubripertincta NBRC 101908 TaxID=1077975 RepID=A0ABQ0HVJ6_GORRU|nr:hypothetical protein GORBP_071_00250 [Gordonia rubripertincta NBRC 101908]
MRELRLDAPVIGDVAFEEYSADRGGDFLTGTARAVDDRDLGPTLGEQFGAGPAHARGASDDDGEFAFDLHVMRLLVR